LAAVRPDPAIAANRCAVLAAKGLISGSTTADQADSAMAKMLANGWEADSIPFMASHFRLALFGGAVTYANAYAKAGVKDNLCGYSFGVTPVNGVPPAMAAAAAAQLFGTG